MTNRTIRDLLDTPDVTRHLGLDMRAWRTFERDLGFTLPLLHRELLEASNGIGAYAGYVRLFGLSSAEMTDIVQWNAQQHWKFAWKGRCDSYWCFAETAWGDQYVYAMDDLLHGEECGVYSLDALSMTPELHFPSFEAFLQDELLRQALSPYDVTLRQARERFGPLPPDLHLIHVPSIHLGGTDDVACADIQDARSAMICNGDIATQVDDPQGSAVAGVESYEDELGRTRLRLLWV